MEEALKCAFCSEVFGSLYKLNVHIQFQHESIHGDKKKICKCNVCGYECINGSTLITHMRMHTGERPFKCKISGCRLDFKQVSHLKSHMNFKHSDQLPFKCDFPDCLYTTKAASNLKAHKNLHSGERPFACAHSGCNYLAKTKGDLLKHTTSNIHSKSITLTCSKCKYRTNIARKLSRHMSVHQGKSENIPCSIDDCDYKGKNSGALKDHMLRHKTLLPCPISGCGRYLTRKVLKDHVKRRNPVEMAFQCPLCFKKFNRRDQLERHCVVHTNEKPLQCGHCEYASATSAHVRRHISSFHAAIEFPFMVHLPDDRECLRCKVTLPRVEFLDHCEGHVLAAPL